METFSEAKEFYKKLLYADMLDVATAHSYGTLQINHNGQWTDWEDRLTGYDLHKQIMDEMYGIDTHE